MEIFNTIWMLLTTPNEFNRNMFIIPFTFIESYIIMSFFLTILNISTNKKSKILYVIISSIIMNICNFFISSPFNVFINYLSSFILIILLFKTTPLKSLISLVSSVAIFGIVSSLILNPYIKLLNINAEIMSSIPIYNIGFLLTIYAIDYILILILRHRKFKINFFDDIDKKNKYVILINFIFGILTLSLQVYITVYYIDKLPIIITFLSCLSLLAYLIISIYSLTRVMKLTLTTRKLESAEEYNKTLHILHDNVRGFKHDFDNIVTTIGGYIRTDDIEGLKNYYLELEDDCQKVNNLYLLNPEIINNPGIYNLLTNKYHEAESKDIKVNMTFLLDLNILKMKIYEFARILGILLDNAIEASSECDEKIINITFRNDEKNNRQLIIIENTYTNKEINTEKIFEKGITEKENHTGLGLWEVRKIISKNNNINLYTSKNDKFFSQQLEIYNK